MPKSNQILKSLEIQNLKGLINLTIDFTERPLTAILGPNGVGKSTILHAIACVNNPVQSPFSTVNHRFSEFFTPTTHSAWAGSSFDAIQDYRDGVNLYTNHITNFRKVRERWSPRYVTRIDRYVSYIGIRTCVPRIESETQQARIQFNTTPLNDNVSNKVRQLAGEIMNRNYNSYSTHRSGAYKTYIGVSSNGVTYSSLSMGAGEQRIFYILSEVIKAPNNGLIIIDEIDLLLHQDALFRLVTRLNTIAEQKKLQIIFTTHAQSLLELDFLAIRHLYPTPTKTLCFTSTKPDALHRLTGKQIRPLELFVEDDLAHALIKKISSEERMSKYVAIVEFGAAINCFTAACGASLNRLDNLQNMLFVTDGDEYRTDDLKRDRIAKVLTGDTQSLIAQRSQVFDLIAQFVMPEGYKPERYYHKLICEVDDCVLTPEQKEIVDAAKQIGNPGDAHKYFDDLIERMDFNRYVGLSKLVDILALSTEWPTVKEKIKVWLDQKKQAIVE